MVKGEGKIYLCATPVGNLEDMTFRAVRVLGEVHLIAAEDTRRTRKLLSHYDLHTSLTSYNEHNHQQKAPYLLDLVAAGKDIALVSDAGMPGISDPGEMLVREAIARGLKVTVLPGANAALSALVISGLPAGSFVFEGFLPAGARARREKLRLLAGEKRTMLFYESPHRLRQTLADLYQIFGHRRMAVVRELTKKFEEVLRGYIPEIIENYIDDGNEPRGEFTLVIAGAGQEDQQAPGGQTSNEPWELSLADHVASFVDQGLHRKEAIKKVARLRGIPKREVYDEAVRGKKTR